MHTDLQGIASHPGFQQLVDYWTREKDIHEKRLDEIKTALLAGKKVPKNQISNVLVGIKIADRFLTFLVNMLSR